MTFRISNIAGQLLFRLSNLVPTNWIRAASPQTLCLGRRSRVSSVAIPTQNLSNVIPAYQIVV